MHGNIVNVPTKLNLSQFVLPQMPYDNSSKKILFEKKLKYKSHIC